MLNKRLHVLLASINIFRPQPIKQKRQALQLKLTLETNGLQLMYLEEQP
jgi:hypothetical protein